MILLTNIPDGPGDYWSRRLRIGRLADRAGTLHAEEVQMSLYAVAVHSPEARHIEVLLAGTLAVRTLVGVLVAGTLARIAGSIDYMDQTCCTVARCLLVELVRLVEWERDPKRKL